MIVEFKDKKPGSTGLSHEHKYEYVGNCSMKDSSLGWVDAVIYYELGHPETPYIRSKKDFLEKFKEVEGDNESSNSKE